MLIFIWFCFLSVRVLEHWNSWAAHRWPDSSEKRTSCGTNVDANVSLRNSFKKTRQHVFVYFASFSLYWPSVCLSVQVCSVFECSSLWPVGSVLCSVWSCSRSVSCTQTPPCWRRTGTAPTPVQPAWHWAVSRWFCSPGSVLIRSCAALYCFCQSGSDSPGVD